MRQPPSWLEVRTPVGPLLCPELGPGESAAITLARQLNADVVLLDDIRARSAALRLGVHMAGTLQVLCLAAERRLLLWNSTMEMLQRTNFRYSKQMVEKLTENLRDRGLL